MKLTDLRSILQYIPQFRERTFVISVDGAIVTHESFGNILMDIAVLRSLNIRVVLVHGASAQIKETASWAGGARIGLAFGPSFFTYMNGGATGTRCGGTSFVSDVTGAPLGAGSAAFWKTGWYLGGGTETSLAPVLPVGFFLRSEYRYSYFNTTTVPVIAGGVTALNVGWHPVVQTLSTSLVYKFNWQ